ncbi:MAG TPA: MFS transporter, partial [Pseudonocardiaceae bacterium]|nr:MFS transporter [Pseudonocardiaceae bacterium]
FAAAKATTQPFGGLWVDRWQPGGVGCVALLVAAAGIAVTAIAHAPLVLLAGRVCWGVGEGLVTPALYSGLTLLCRRYGMSTSQWIGRLGSASVCGFLVGPLVVGAAARAGLQTLFLIGAVATALTGGAVLAAVRGQSDAGEASGDGDQPAADQHRGAGLKWWHWVLLLGGLDMVTNLSYSALEPTLPLYLVNANGAATRGEVSALFVIGLATFGVSSWFAGKHAGRRTLFGMIRFGLLIGVAGLGGLAISTRLVPVAAGFVLIMIGQSVLYLAARQGVAARASATDGHAFGLFGLISDIGNITGPLVGVALYEWTGRLVFPLLGIFSVALLVTLAVRPRTAVVEQAE